MGFQRNPEAAEIEKNLSRTRYQRFENECGENQKEEDLKTASPTHAQAWAQSPHIGQNWLQELPRFLSFLALSSPKVWSWS